MENLLPQTSARDLALIVFKRKWSLLAIFAATMAAFFVWLFLIHDDMYEVDAKVLVKIGREQAAPPSVMGASPMLVAYRSQDLNSELDIFQSGDSIAHVVDELHLDQPTVQPVPEGFLARAKYELKQAMRVVKDWYDEMMINIGMHERLSRREKTIFALRQGLSLHAQKDSNVFIASLTLPQRVGSARVVNALVDRYLELRQTLYHNQDTSFFQSAVDSSGAKLQDAEQRLQAFENEGGIAQLEKQESVLIEQVAMTRAAWKEADYARQEFEGRIVRLDAELKKSDPELAGVAEFGYENFQQSVMKQLADLQREREKLRMTELDDGDRIQNNRQQFARLAQILSVNLRTALAEKEQQTALRRAAYEAMDQQLKQLHDKQAQWAGLKRKTQDGEIAYQLFRRKLEEAAADDAMQARQISNVSVIERANDPLAPAGMRKTTLLEFALAGALLAALFWVTVAEFFDDRVYTVDQLHRHVTTQVLASIPAGVRLETKGSRAKSANGGPLSYGAPRN
jgi:uncharacterized protein involved in exopolysaccharide biosynthesis